MFISEYNLKKIRAIKSLYQVQNNRDLAFSVIGQLIAEKAYMKTSTYDFFNAYRSIILDRYQITEDRIIKSFSKWAGFLDLIEVDWVSTLDDMIHFSSNFEGFERCERVKDVYEIRSFNDLMNRFRDPLWRKSYDVSSIMDFGHIYLGYRFFTDHNGKFISNNDNTMIELFLLDSKFVQFLSDQLNMEKRSFYKMIYYYSGMNDSVSIDLFFSYFDEFVDKEI